MSGRPLSSGSPLSGGSTESKIIIGLVVVAVVLAAVAFALFAANQAQDKSLKAKQSELDAMGLNFSKASDDYADLNVSFAALNANFTSLTGEYATVQANYQNVTDQYLALQNRSNAADTRLNTFLENAPTIAFTWALSTKPLPDNATDKLLTVTAYNLGKAGDATIKVTCTVRLGNATNTYNQTFPSVMSLDKRVATWEFSDDADVIYVWAGLG